MTTNDEVAREKQEALAKKQQRAEELKLDPTKRHDLQKSINASEAMEQQRVKESVKQMRDEKRREEVKKGQYWDNLKKKVDSYTEVGGQSSYVQWNTHMMNILGVGHVLAQAMHHDDVYLRGLKYVFWDSKPGLAVRQLVSGQIEKGNEALIEGGVKNRPVPLLEYTINVNEKGELESEVKTQEGRPLREDLKEEFDAGVIFWASERGYNWGPDPADPSSYIFTDKNDPSKRMTPEILKALDKGDERGLKAFFEGKFQVELAPQESSPPRP